MPAITVVQYFVSILVLAGSFGGGLYLLVRRGKRQEKQWHQSMRREPRYWDALTVAYREGDLDEFEEAISGDIDSPPLMKVQRN